MGDMRLIESGDEAGAGMNEGCVGVAVICEPVNGAMPVGEAPGNIPVIMAHGGGC